jgi:hypothetical protein
MDLKPGARLTPTPQLGGLLRHEVGAAAGLHHDRAGLEVHQVLDKRYPIEFFAVKLMPTLILRMQVKGVLSQIDGGIATLFMATVSDGPPVKA